LDVEIAIYHTTGAIGAARACLLVDGDVQAYSALVEENDYKLSYQPQEDKQAYSAAYELWKQQLEQELKSLKK